MYTKHSPFDNGGWVSLHGAEEFYWCVLEHRVGSQPNQELGAPDHGPLTYMRLWHLLVQLLENRELLC